MEIGVSWIFILIMLLVLLAIFGFGVLVGFLLGKKKRNG